MKCREIYVSHGLNRFKFGGYSLNPYRGCSHGCIYCYASAEHWRRGLERFYPTAESYFETIIVKKNLPSVLSAELMRLRPDEIHIGTVTDPYQPCEAVQKVTRTCLERINLMPPERLWITTKNTLILRDIDILKRLSEESELTILITITTLDKAKARWLEPNAPTPDMRLKAVKNLSKIARVGILMAPVMPGINDNPKDVIRLAREAYGRGASFISLDALRLPTGTRERFIARLRKDAPHLAGRYIHLYRKANSPAVARRVERLKSLISPSASPPRPSARTYRRNISRLPLQ